MSNFCPICVTNFFSKILKRVVSYQIIAHFNKHHLFSQRQSGFCYGHSTQDVLLHVLNSFSDAIEHGEYVGTIF